ncbi:MAG: response regulator, partial [Acidobacteria bacterium]|nr:response regulator [Acidobacteriota bacterium]
IIYLPFTRITTPEIVYPKNVPTKGQGRVLVLDDEELVRNATGEILKHLGYDVLLAEKPEKMILMMNEASARKNPIEVVIMDLTIPGSQSAEETIIQLRESFPTVIIIAASGYSSDPIMVNHKQYGFDYAVAKPFGISELSSAIEKARGKSTD